MVIDNFAIKSNPSHAQHECGKMSVPPRGSEVTGLPFAELTVQAGKGKRVRVGWRWMVVLDLRCNTFTLGRLGGRWVIAAFTIDQLCH